MTFISRNRRLLEKTFFTDKEKFQAFSKVPILAKSRLKLDQIITLVQIDELLRTMRKHTYLISPQSREIEDFYRLFFTD